MFGFRSSLNQNTLLSDPELDCMRLRLIGTEKSANEIIKNNVCTIIKNMLSWFNETYTCVVRVPFQFPSREKENAWLFSWYIVFTTTSAAFNANIER